MEDALKNLHSLREIYQQNEVYEIRDIADLILFKIIRLNFDTHNLDKGYDMLRNHFKGFERNANELEGFLHVLVRVIPIYMYIYIYKRLQELAWKAALLRKFGELISNYQLDVNPLIDYNLFQGFYFKVIKKLISSLLISKLGKLRDNACKYFKYSNLRSTNAFRKQSKSKFPTSKIHYSQPLIWMILQFPLRTISKNF